MDSYGQSYFQGQASGQAGMMSGISPQLLLMQQQQMQMQMQQMQMQMMSAQRDWMARGSAYAGNHSFGGAPGINTGNPIIDIPANIGLQNLLGADFNHMRPFQPTGMSDVDFLTSRMRTTSIQDPSVIHRVLAGNAGYMRRRYGEAADSVVFQQTMDQFNPGGSQVEAFMNLYGRIGTTSFGPDMYAQREGTMGVFKHMQAAFIGSNGGHDYQKAYGFDLSESAEALDVASRYGLGGMSSERLRRVGNFNGPDDRFQEDVRGVNKLFNSAKQIFGEDKSMDELGALINQTIEGVQGMDAGKASDLLAKIQAASRVVGISTQAFVEYSRMMDDMYKSAGAVRGPGIEGVANVIFGASAAVEMGRNPGDGSRRAARMGFARDSDLSDMNKVMGAAARNSANQGTSPAMNKITALAAMSTNLSDEQQKSIRIAGYGTLYDMLGGGGLQKALDAGDGDAVMKMLNAADTQMEANPYIRRGAIADKARGLTSADHEKAARVLNLSNLPDMNGSKMRKEFVNSMASGDRIDSDIMAKIGHKGLESLMGKIDTFMEGTSKDQVLYAINKELGGMGLSEEQKDRFASQFALDMQRKTGNERYLQTFGFKSSLDANVGFTSGSEQGIKISKAERARKEKSQYDFVQAIAGNAFKPISRSDIVEVGGQLLEDFDREDSDPQKLTIEKLMDTKNWETYIKKYGHDFLKIPQIKAAMAAMEGGGTEEAEQARTDAYRKKLNETGGDKEEARRAGDIAFTEKANELARKANKDATGEEDYDPKLSPAENAALNLEKRKKKVMEENPGMSEKDAAKIAGDQINKEIEENKKKKEEEEKKKSEAEKAKSDAGVNSAKSLDEIVKILNNIWTAISSWLGIGKKDNTAKGGSPTPAPARGASVSGSAGGSASASTGNP